MPNDDVVALAREIDNLMNLQDDTIQPAKLKEISASQLKEYEIRREKIRQLCAQLEKIGSGD
jgi:hypothetical protein